MWQIVRPDFADAANWSTLFEVEVKGFGSITTFTLDQEYNRWT